MRRIKPYILFGAVAACVAAAGTAERAVFMGLPIPWIRIAGYFVFVAAWCYVIYKMMGD